MSRAKLLQGTLEFIILESLGGQCLHGFEILRWIEQATGGELLVEEGALYPALHRMQKKGWLRSEWGVSEKGRRAKYYELTAKGSRQRDRAEVDWKDTVRLIGTVVAAGRAERAR